MTMLVLHLCLPMHVRWVKVTNENSRGYDIGSSKVVLSGVDSGSPTCHVIFGKYPATSPTFFESRACRNRILSRTSESVGANYISNLNGGTTPILRSV
jgi:hypothetical protein